MSNEQPDNKIEPTKPKVIITDENIDNVRQMYSNPNSYNPEELKLRNYYKLNKSTEKLTPVQEKEMKKTSEELGMIYGLQNGIWAGNLARTQYFGTLYQMRKSIVKDYNCQSSLELMLADRIVAHYWRSMRNDAVINMLTEEKDGGYSFNQQKINILKELHRGVEMSDRQLSANILLLKDLKQPKLNIKVNTENAYIAQNQQVVNTDKNGSKSVKDELLRANDLGNK
jgi:hypothetical protein